MRCWSILCLMAACAADPHMDFSPNAVDWEDFENVSTTQQLTGLDRFIRIQLAASFDVGAPTIEYEVKHDGWRAFSPSEPTTIVLGPGATLQFRVGGANGDAATINVSNLSTGGRLLDAVQGVVEDAAGSGSGPGSGSGSGSGPSPITGSGTQSSPYVAPNTPPTSCATFLSAYPQMMGHDGTYRIQPTTTTLDVYCDMTTDSGGWTLVARVLGTSTTHVNANALDTVTTPTQATTAKYADATINTLGFTMARFAIENTGVVYSKVTSLALGGTTFSLPNTTAPSMAGPFTHKLWTMVTCSSDCGVATVDTDMGFGRMCGYRYYASQGNPRPGMGCQTGAGKAGSVWVR